MISLNPTSNPVRLIFVSPIYTGQYLGSESLQSKYPEATGPAAGAPSQTRAAAFCLGGPAAKDAAWDVLSIRAGK